MSSIAEIAQIRPRVDAHKFLQILMALAKRVEGGNSGSISITECTTWGVSDKEAVQYLLLLVEVGILEQKVQIFDKSDDTYEDYNGQDLESLDANRVKFWFTPALSDAEFSRFFVQPLS